MKKIKITTTILAASLIGAALLTIGGLGFAATTGEMSKLSYSGNLWCVSNWIEEEDASGNHVYLPQPDGRAAKDHRLQGKEDWLRMDQVQAENADEAEKAATRIGLFEKSDKTELRGALDKSDKAFFTSHFNTGATHPGPCVGTGYNNGMIGSWINDAIRQDCFGITPNNAGCGFDEKKLGLYSGGGSDQGVDYAKSAAAKEHAIGTLGIDPDSIRQYARGEVEDMIRAEVAKQFVALPNKHDSTQEQAQQAILSYQQHESDAWQLFKNGVPSYTSGGGGHALNILSLTDDKFANSNNMRVAASYDIRYAIYLGVKEFMGNFASSSVSGTGETRWKNTLGYVFLPKNPSRYWSDARASVARDAWNHYANENAYVCPKQNEQEAQKLENAPAYCPDTPPPAGQATDRDYRSQIAEAFTRELNKYAELAATSDDNSSPGSEAVDQTFDASNAPDSVLRIPAIDERKYGLLGRCNIAAAGMAFAYRTGKFDIELIKRIAASGNTYGVLAALGTGVRDVHRAATADSWQEIKYQVLVKKNPVVLATNFGSKKMHYITITGFVGSTVYFNDGAHFVGNGSAGQVQNRSASISYLSAHLNHATSGYRFLYAK